MTNEERAHLFRQSLAAVVALEAEYPGFPVLRSIQDQLQFLIGQAEGSPRDQDRLDQINIGVLTAKNVEDLNEQVADLLHHASAEARKMRAEC